MVVQQLLSCQPEWGVLYELYSLKASDCVVSLAKQYWVATNDNNDDQTELQLKEHRNESRMPEREHIFEMLFVRLFCRAEVSQGQND